MNGEDKDLGMGRPIQRRDFIQGVAAAAGGFAFAGGAAPASAAATAKGFVMADGPVSPANYPPMRSGMRGAHPGAFESAHALRDGESFPAPQKTGETYDLVVVGRCSPICGGAWSSSGGASCPRAARAA